MKVSSLPYGDSHWHDLLGMILDEDLTDNHIV